ncbi:substrate-binding domain-containing protein [Methylobacterium sp. WSM2598]|uniref:substrate-binding domain-containing protein n=1 Tax=Methylobacterium sp. WSM2598 TaxID=398261 RepID=UPI00037A7E11|nr:substrate-binding domain-containing protein [Methylobacterium sp. WSM2598]
MAQGLRLRIGTGGRDRIYAALGEGHADLAVTASLPEGRGLGFAELGRERLLLVAAPALAARAKGRIVAADILRGLPCIAYDEGLPLIRPFFAQVFDGLPDLQAVATAPDLRLLTGMAVAGVGWTVLPDYVCAEALALGRLTELPTAREGPDNALYLAWNPGALRQQRVVAVRDHLLRGGPAL